MHLQAVASTFLVVLLCQQGVSAFGGALGGVSKVSQTLGDLLLGQNPEVQMFGKCLGDKMGGKKTEIVMNALTSASLALENKMNMGANQQVPEVQTVFTCAKTLGNAKSVIDTVNAALTNKMNMLLAKTQ